MNILFDGQAFVHQARGGVTRYYTNLLTGLDAKPGCEARIVLPLHRNEHLREVDPGLVHGFAFPTSWPGGTMTPARQDWMCWMATRALSPPMGRLYAADVVHETYFAPKPYLTRARRRVTTMFDMIHEIYALDGFTTAHKRQSLARCDHVICCSQSTRRDLCELMSIPPERTSVVLLGYQDFGGFGDGPLPAGVAAMLDGAPYFLAVGQRGEYKNFNAFLRAFAASPTLRRDLRIVCFGGGPLTTGELDLIGELGLERDHIIQTGGEDADLASAYRHALALVYPSLYEGFGLPPLEAMSAGCPVLCSNTSSLPEVVGDAAITFDPTDVDAIRAALERVAQSPGVRDDLIRRGDAQRRLFSWQRCVDETLAVYRTLN